MGLSLTRKVGQRVRFKCGDQWVWLKVKGISTKDGWLPSGRVVLEFDAEDAVAIEREEIITTTPAPKPTCQGRLVTALRPD